MHRTGQLRSPDIRYDLNGISVVAWRELLDDGNHPHLAKKTILLVTDGHDGYFLYSTHDDTCFIDLHEGDTEDTVIERFLDMEHWDIELTEKEQKELLSRPLLFKINPSLLESLKEVLKANVFLAPWADSPSAQIQWHNSLKNHQHLEPFCLRYTCESIDHLVASYSDVLRSYSPYISLEEPNLSDGIQGIESPEINHVLSRTILFLAENCDTVTINVQNDRHHIIGNNFELFWNGTQASEQGIQFTPEQVVYRLVHTNTEQQITGQENIINFCNNLVSYSDDAKALLLTTSERDLIASLLRFNLGRSFHNSSYPTATVRFDYKREHGDYDLNFLYSTTSGTNIVYYKDKEGGMVEISLPRDRCMEGRCHYGITREHIERFQRDANVRIIEDTISTGSIPLFSLRAKGNHSRSFELDTD